MQVFYSLYTTTSLTTMFSLLLLRRSLIVHPDDYFIEPDKCSDLLLQCLLYFSSQDRVAKCAKIAKLQSLLTGKALIWETALWSQHGESFNPSEHLITLLKGKETSKNLLGLKQEGQRANNFTLYFC